jgi:hypothetical protein
MADALVITQSASSLTIEQSRGDRSQTVEYALDGSDTTIEQGRGGVLTVTATWDGGTPSSSPGARSWKPLVATSRSR